MAKPPNAKNRQALPGLDFCPSQGSVHRDPGAKKRGGLYAGKPVRNLQRVARGRLYEFGITPVYSHPGNLLFDAKVFITFTTESALPAGPVHPRYAHSVAQCQIRNCSSFFHNAAGDFVPEDQRSLRDWHDLRPIAICHVQIRVTYATRLHRSEE